MSLFKDESWVLVKDSLMMSLLMRDCSKFLLQQQVKLNCQSLILNHVWGVSFSEMVLADPCHFPQINICLSICTLLLLTYSQSTNHVNKTRNQPETCNTSKWAFWWCKNLKKKHLQIKQLPYWLEILNLICQFLN